MTLLVAPCSKEAAVYSVMSWHYSKKMPSSRLVHFGVWESDEFKGAVIFGRGASPQFYKHIGLEQIQGAELVRVALTTHQAPVTQIVSQALRLLKETSPGLRGVFSFADPLEGHLGKIYQAGNWIYIGRGSGSKQYYVNGKWRHNRTIDAADTSYYTQKHNLLSRRTPGKYRYLYPFTKGQRRAWNKLSQPYPTELAEEKSTVTRPPSRQASQVRSLDSAPNG